MHTKCIVRVVCAYKVYHVSDIFCVTECIVRVMCAYKVYHVSDMLCVTECVIYHTHNTHCIGLFCRISSLLKGSFAKETYMRVICAYKVNHTHDVLCVTECIVRCGVATVSRIDKILGLFCRISSLF